MLRRVFLAVPIPAAIQTSLSHFSNSLSDERIKWVKPENYHITVSFFGEQEDFYLPHITEAISPITDTFLPFTLYFDDILFAPPGKVTSMIWAQFQLHEEFMNLVTLIEENVKEILPFSDKREGHMPIPHITLARFKTLPTERIPQIALDPITVRSIGLYESSSSEAGRVYAQLESFPLNAS